MKFKEVYSQVFEADDFKKTREYRKLNFLKCYKDQKETLASVF